MRLFSTSEAVVSAFASMVPLLIASVVLDSTQGVLSGVARGCGWQHLAAWTNLVAFYIIGMPLGPGRPLWIHSWLPDQGRHTSRPFFLNF